MIKQQVCGTVYGVILNDTVSVQKIGSLEDAPYKGAPKAPVLYLKPANTRVACGSTVNLPQGAKSVEVAATIGLVMGRAAGRLAAGNALESVAGIVLAADLSLPHSSYYRPAIREKCFDGALPISSVKPLADLAGLTLTTEIDGQVVDTRSLTDLIRSPAKLLADVSEWMTLSQGDVLLVGVRYMAPQAKAGSAVRISAEGLGSLNFTIAEGVAA
ncbi:fumarylacetoacetate hydrolase family protein [Ferribacterium limneticum]|uniref:fumarylacetoacetate hydrolase family protein n=1 Tax=Ferribacterium limneticum TaxID=76259 RepID=UPI001CFB8433|nr:fumarylacetoacetate hydrolase family protein [Ferribacterium limneticum]UCV27047.1 fumarylacetoacetate hydrolase family protein [Ferribacterium limneticum]UCV30964.1 fumarylacetoacetate hydrolase family protein [Ferribacterium limneticum]